MTPDERALLTRFLSDLSQVRAGPQDPEATALINQAMAAQPDAAYLLVQHSLLADQALHSAQARIETLEAQLRAPAPQGQSGSFLGGGYAPPPQPAYAPQGYVSQGYSPTAVPVSPPPSASQGFFGGGAPAAPGGFGNFLRSAGATAAGVAGGEFLFSGLSNLFGGGHRGGGFFGGGYDQPVENVTVNNYGDDGGYDDGGYDNGGGWGDDGSGGGDFS
jgi:hypothetical protein